MAKPAITGFSLLHAALVGAAAFALLASPFAIGEAVAGVGVTSATDGDPLGKPPAEAERVLRIGIDVQANEPRAGFLRRVKASARGCTPPSSRTCSQGKARPLNGVESGRLQQLSHHRG